MDFKSFIEDQNVNRAKLTSEIEYESSQKMASENSITISIKYEYASNILKEYAKRQSIERKTEIQGSEEISIYFSLGLVNIDSFMG